ncbi:hypothetical protein [Brevibacillus porteri]|uniref:hypothetical protein n=1 Tax=Brevibacillus porteri TaxID=2126350 RepID=UPI001FCA1511|nr:hypothetical protein [Brevibacillus porteri]MED1801627.1 hypothetical protein [Brevibacillus porteri]MED2133458.1 hypothetical protein [Brevibacillus porteri]MED2743694.1 hypothetical protein [Brevibacillus porteri]MED2816461.1 hypothetical protein [Brevibacillus porteri]MED2893505.1 hypothetical protein [Brevibacillus porteri]
MDWYSYLYQYGAWMSKPFSDLYYGMGEQAPLIGALLLGIVGAFAPCQLSGNVAAFTVFGKNVVVRGGFRSHVWMFILGKAVVYSALGATDVYFDWIVLNRMDSIAISTYAII